MVYYRLVRFRAVVTVLGRDLVEVCDFPEAVFSVIGQTDVEEAGIFLSHESVHVGTGWDGWSD